MTLHPRAQTQVGSGRSLKRLKRSCRRWQLNFATGLTRKVAPSACAKYLRYPRRSQDTPSSLELQIYRQVNYGAYRAYPQGEKSVCFSWIHPAHMFDAIAHRRPHVQASLSPQAKRNSHMNIRKHIWVAGIIIPVPVVAGWIYSRVGMGGV